MKIKKQKKNNYILIGSILLVCVTLIVAVLTVRSSYYNSKQTEKINGFNEQFQKNQQYLNDFTDTVDEMSNYVLFYSSTNNSLYMNNYCNKLEKECKREKAILNLQNSGLSELETSNLSKAKRNSDDLVQTELWTFRMLAQANGVAFNDMPQSVREVSLTDKEKNATNTEKRKLANNYIHSTKYSTAKNSITISCESFSKAFTKRYFEALDATMNSANDNIHFVSAVIVLVLLFQIVLFWIYVEYSKKQIKKLNDANKAKSVFLSNMSHDMRTPMNAILSFSSFGKESSDVAQLQDYHKKVHFAGHYLLSLINDTLDLSKIETGKFTLNQQAHSLNNMMNAIQNIVLSKAQEKQVNVHFDNSNTVKEDFYITCDNLRVEQICINIINNAIKFTPKDGDVYLNLQVDKLNQNNAKLILTVKDTGVGMSKDFIDNKLYKEFEQEKNSSNETGTGLGLSIVYKLITLMHGSIDCQSKLGKGTTFTVVIPFTLAEKTDKQVVKLNSNFTLAGKKILIVDDQPMNRQILEKILKSKDISLSMADNGQKAVDVFESSNLGEFDAILMDISMPVMNGLEASKTIRKLKRKDASKVPIIAMTANAFSEDIKKSLQAGMNNHLSKPIDVDVLFKVLSQNISNYESEKDKFINN